MYKVYRGLLGLLKDGFYDDNYKQSFEKQYEVDLTEQLLSQHKDINYAIARGLLDDKNDQISFNNDMISGFMSYNYSERVKPVGINFFNWLNQAGELDGKKSFPTRLIVLTMLNYIFIAGCALLFFSSGIFDFNYYANIILSITVPMLILPVLASVFTSLYLCVNSCKDYCLYSKVFKFVKLSSTHSSPGFVVVPQPETRQQP